MGHNYSTRLGKFLACLLSIVLVCTSMFALPTEKIMAATYGDFTYSVQSGNIIRITKYNGSGGNVTIPSTIEGKRVDQIFSGSFSGSSVTSVFIPDTVTTINSSAFAGCSLLESVTIPSSVTSIGTGAFSYCSEDLTIKCYANSTAQQFAIDNNIYYEIISTPTPTPRPTATSTPTSTPRPTATSTPTPTTVVTPTPAYEYRILEDNTVEIVRPLGSINRLTEVIIPSTIDGLPVSTIGEKAFEDCHALTRVVISEGVTTIGLDAFFECTNLESVEIPETVTYIESGAFMFCQQLSEIDLPDGLTYIGGNVFYGTGDFEEIVIPSSLTEISPYMFYGANVENIVFPETVNVIGEAAFLHCHMGEHLTIPNGCTSIESFAFRGCSLSTITIPRSVTNFGYDRYDDAYYPQSVFDDCEDIVICCYEGSAAHQFAIEMGISYELLSDPTPTPTPSQGNGAIPPATGNTVDRNAAEAFVTRCYELVLNRTPDSIGLNNWTNSLVNNQNTGAHTAYGFFFSQEYINSNTSNEEYVTTLYNVFLDRQPDPSGLADWVGQLEAGATREQIFAGVANSREFFALCNSYGITAGHYIQGIDNTRQQNVNAFVARLYSMCLGRNGDYDGQANWVRQLINRQNSGAGVAYGFFFSQEFINRNLTNEEYVATLYRVFLGREPDQAGFNSWVSQLNGGADRLSIFRGFAHSQEYTNICSSYGIERGTI